MAVPDKKLTKGDIQNILGQLDGFVDALQRQWDEKRAGAGWLWVNRGRLVDGTRFVLASLDQMIQWVEDIIPSGVDKKAAVMMMAGKLFDYVVAPAFPIWLKPATPLIRELVVNILVSAVIDFIVSKYHTGIWMKDENAQ